MGENTLKFKLTVEIFTWSGVIVPLQKRHTVPKVSYFIIVTRY